MLLGIEAPGLSFSEMDLWRVFLGRAFLGVKKVWGFPKIGVPQNGWFIMENPIKRDDLGVPYFRKHPCG